MAAVIYKNPKVGGKELGQNAGLKPLKGKDFIEPTRALWAGKSGVLTLGNQFAGSKKTLITSANCKLLPPFPILGKFCFKFGNHY